MPKEYFFVKMAYIVFILLVVFSCTCRISTLLEKCVIKEETVLECENQIPTSLPVQTQTVTLNNIKHDGVLNFIDSSWRNVKRLSLQFGQQYSERYMTLHNYEFSNLTNLQYFQISTQAILHIQEYAFNGTNKLEILDLGNNKLFSLAELVRGIEGNILPNLIELYLANISVNSKRLMIDRNFHEAVKYKQLKVLDISNIQALELDLRSYEFVDLEILNISGSGHAIANLYKAFQMKSYKSDSKRFVGSNLTAFRNLKVLDLSHPLLSLTPGTESCSPGWLGERCSLVQYVFVCVPRRLQELYIRNIFKSNIELKGHSNSSVVCIQTKVWIDITQELCVYGDYSNLHKLDAAENNIRYIEPSLMNAFRNLRYLDLSKNRLSNALAYGHYAQSIFGNLNKAKTLILSYNSISYLPTDTFRACSSLQDLDLSHNLLSTLSFETNYLEALLTLDLSFNNIPYVNLSTINHPRGQNMTSPMRRNGSLTHPVVKLKGNLFSCSCESLQFLRKLEMLNETNTCTLEGELVVITDSIIKKTKYLCKVSIVQGVFTSLAIVEVVLIFVTTCCISREFKKIKIKNKLKQAAEHYNTPLKFAVFVSICGSDTDFVMDNIYENLNIALMKQLDTNSRCVSIGDLDFRPGLSVGNEIIRCIQESFTVLFVVSYEFCKSEWCKNEVLTAHAAGKPVILLHIENVELCLLPKIIQLHYQRYVHVHCKMKNNKLIISSQWDAISVKILQLISEKLP